MTLGWICLVFHQAGYFHLGSTIEYEFDRQRLIETLEYWPEDSPLPVIVYRRFISGAEAPPFKYGLVKRKRKVSDGGCAVIAVFLETDLTADMLNQPRLQKPRYVLWCFEDRDNLAEILREHNLLDKLSSHLGELVRACDLSDYLTRWLRGNVGWIRGPKPYWTISDFMQGFQPRWRRKPLTPEMLKMGESEGWAPPQRR